MILKRIFSLLLSVLLLASLLAVMPKAEEIPNFVFVNGENITRSADTVIIYKGVATTGQTQWGHNIVIDENGNVTDIVEAGLTESENLAVPENGAVISASGTKAQWFKTNIKVGSRVYYDSYTQRLFLCDANGNFDPYFEKSFEINGEGNYYISDPLAESSPIYTYDIIVSAEGFIVARGSGLTVPEGGFSISAATESSMQQLIMYSPLGAKCVVKDGVATISYDKNSFKRTLEYELANSEGLINASLAEYRNISSEAMNTVLAEIRADMGNLNYRSLISHIERLENEINRLCTPDAFYETRGAFHTPAETDINQVRAVVKKAKSAGLNTLFIRVSNGYGTCVPMPEGSKFAQDSKYSGFDVLKAYITVCEEENIALGLSLEVYYNQYASIAAPEWMTKQNGSGKGLTDKYYSPQNKAFKEYYLEYVKYIVSNYDIKTVMFEHLRYPKFQSDCDLGYDSATLNEFSDSYQIPIGEANDIAKKLFDSPHWEKWVEYKTSLVTDMAKSLSEAVHSVRTDITLLAAAGRDSVSYYYMQDSIGWIEEDIFDGLCLVLYEGDSDEKDKTDLLSYSDKFVESKSELFAAYTAKEKYFLTALESEKSFPAEVIASAIAEGRALNSDGFIMSSLDSYCAQNYYSYLESSSFKSGSVSSLSNDKETAKALLEYAKTKINGYILSLGGTDADTAALGLSKINNILLMLDSEMLGYEEAKSLENDIAMLFSASPAKQAVLKEFEALTKLSLLHKTATEIAPPLPPEESTPDISTPETSVDESEEISEEESTQEESVGVPVQIEKQRVAFGDILVYAFVGLAFIGGATAMIIAIKRKNTRPKNAHMPKASIKENQDNE